MLFTKKVKHIWCNCAAVPHNNQQSPRSVGLVAFTWLLATFFIVNIYSSCMASYMSLRFQRPDISTFEDLANNPNYQLTTVKGGIAERIFLVSPLSLKKTNLSYLLKLDKFILLRCLCRKQIQEPWEKLEINYDSASMRLMIVVSQTFSHRLNIFWQKMS